MNAAVTGRPLALIDGVWVTEMRAPSVSAQTKRQVDTPVVTLSIIWCGAQGRGHLIVALAGHPEVHTVRAFDRSPDAFRALSHLAQRQRVVSALSASEAIEGPDMVIAGLTAKLEPSLEADSAADDAVSLPLDYDDAIAASAEPALDYRAQYDAALNRDLDGFRNPDAERADLVAGRTSIRPRAAGSPQHKARDGEHRRRNTRAGTVARGRVW